MAPMALFSVGVNKAAIEGPFGHQVSELKGKNVSSGQAERDRV
jgi:hypothetical protein